MLLIFLFILEVTGLFESQDFLSAFQSSQKGLKLERWAARFNFTSRQDRKTTRGTIYRWNTKKYPLFYDGKSCLFPSYLNIVFPKLLETVRQMDGCFWNQSSGHGVLYHRLASVRITLRVADGIGGSSLPQLPCSARDCWAQPFPHSSALMSSLGTPPWGHRSSRCHPENKPCLCDISLSLVL